LGLFLLSVIAVWSDHLDALLAKRLLERIGVVSLVSYETNCQPIGEISKSDEEANRVITATDRMNLA
jgi:hypothetical protein